MANPIAIRTAKKIAEEAAGRSVSYDRVWIEKGMNAHLNGYEVRFTLPRTDGFFICDETLDLTAEEFADYEAWQEAR
ncbi:hypothetical protein ACWIDW_04910 [Microbacterium sp. NPDC055312]